MNHQSIQAPDQRGPGARLANRLLVQAAVGLAFSAAAPLAHAIDVVACPSCNIAISTAASTISGSISSAITSNTAQVIAVLKALSQGTNAQIAQAAKMTSDTAVTVAGNTERTSIDKQYRVGDPCAVAIAGTNSAEAVYAVSANGAAIGRGRPMSVGGGSYAGASAQLTKALSWSKGAAPAPSPDVQAQTAAAGACGSFVSSGPRAEACRNAQFGAANSVGYENADITADTVFDGPQSNLDQPVRRRTVDLDGNSKERTAVEAFVRNVESPLNFRSLDKGELSTQQGRRYMALKDMYDARISLAGRPLRRHIASISANTATLPMVKQMLESPTASAFVTQQLDRNFPAWRTKGISQDELMTLEVDRRYRNLEWYKYLVANRDEVPLEQVQLSALIAVQNQQIIQELRELNMVVGSQAAGQVRSELMQQLAEAHRAATTR